MCELCESVYRPGDRFADFWRRLQRRHEERCEALRVSWLLDFQNGFWRARASYIHAEFAPPDPKGGPHRRRQGQPGTPPARAEG